MSTEKKKLSFYEKPVYHPDDIPDWHDLFVYVPYNYYDEISLFLRELGLKEEKDFTRYENILHLDAQIVINNIIETNKKLFSINKTKCKKLFMGTQIMETWDSLGIYIQELSKNGVVDHIFSLEYSLSEDRIKEEIGIETTLLPYVWDHRIVVKGALVSQEQKAIINEHSYLKNAIAQYREFSSEMDEETCIFIACSVREYVLNLIDQLKPESIISYSAVTPQNYILKCICEKKNIPIVLTHPGTIPGTHYFDVKGEMGASLPAVYSERFCNLPIGEEDLFLAQNVWEYLYKSKLNRKRQPKNKDIRSWKDRINLNRPTVFYAGQCDVFAQMIPYTEYTMKYFSPIFKSSVEGALYLDELCRKNNWNYIYKPHPLYVKPEEKEKLSSNTIYVDSADINEVIDSADVVVTILSTTNYNALIRFKPVVMLGYNQVRGMGCTYEAFKKDEIETTIRQAIKEGFTIEQKNAFMKHIALCLQYYLYDDLSDRPIRYGKSVAKSIDDFYELAICLENRKGYPSSCREVK